MGYKRGNKKSQFGLEHINVHFPGNNNYHHFLHEQLPKTQLEKTGGARLY